MFARKTFARITKVHIIFIFLISNVTANCVNKTLVYKDILKSPLSGTFPDLPLESFGNKFYYFGAIFEGNYFQAMQYCNYHGMTLLSIETPEENNFLFEKSKTFLGGGEYYFWTSGTTLPDAHWIWMSTGRPILYTSWLPNQPDNAGNNESCLEARYSPTFKTLMWNDHVCTILKHVICETAVVRCLDNN